MGGVREDRPVRDGEVTRGVAAAAALIAVVTVGARLAGFGRTVVFSTLR